MSLAGTEVELSCKNVTSMLPTVYTILTTHHMHSTYITLRSYPLLSKLLLKQIDVF